MAVIEKTNRILYFIADMAPTDAERAAAGRLGTNFVFRNASYVDKESAGQLEKCIGVAGCVPDVYAAAFPVVDKKSNPLPKAPPAPPVGAWTDTTAGNPST